MFLSNMVNGNRSHGNAPTDSAMTLSSRHTLLFPLSFSSFVYFCLYLNPERKDKQRLVMLVRLLYSLVSILIYLFVLLCPGRCVSLRDCHYLHYLVSPPHLPLCLNPKYGQSQTCQLQESHLLGFHLISPLQPVSPWCLLVSTGSFSWVNRLTCWLQSVCKLHQVKSNTFQGQL